MAHCSIVSSSGALLYHTHQLIVSSPGALLAEIALRRARVRNDAACERPQGSVKEMIKPVYLPIFHLFSRAKAAGSPEHHCSFAICPWFANCGTTSKGISLWQQGSGRRTERQCLSSLTEVTSRWFASPWTALAMLQSVQYPAKRSAVVAIECGARVPAKCHIPD